MSSLDKDTVKKIAYLARLEVPEEKLAPIATDLTKILDWVEQLSEVNTDGIEPISSVADMSLFLRKDEITAPKRSEQVLSNAPDRQDGYFLVPKVME